MATFVSDTFTDAAGTQLSSHVGETGAQWAKHPSSSANTVSISAQGRLVTSGSAALYLASGVPAAADYDVAWDLVVAGLSGGNQGRVCGRLDPTAHTYYGLEVFANGNLQLVKVVAGATTQLAGPFGFTPTVGQTYRIVLEMRGTALRVLVDGVQKIAVTDASIAAAGRVGIRSNGVVSEPALHVDNLAASDAITLDTTPPAAPTGLAATPGDTQVALSWTANAESDLAGYRLYRDGVGVYDGAAATFTDATVVNGTTYSYTVSAYDTAGNESAPSTAVQATPIAPDTVPPVTTISVPPNTAISNKPGFDTFDVTITADEPFVEYELRRVPTDGATRTEGTLIETATIAATTSLTTTITYAEFSGGEGTNTIKGWTRDAAGNWSTGTSAGTTLFTEPFFGALSSSWNLVQRVAEDRITVVSMAGAADGQAGRFEVRFGDHVNGETNSRAELGWTDAPSNAGMASQGEELTYSWRTMFATDYPSANTWQIFLQWKNEGSGTPPLGMGVEGEVISIHTGPNLNYKKLWTTPLVRGQWLDFSVRVYWSESAATGWVEVTYNGQQVLARTYLATLYPGLRNYLKTGLYRDAAIQGTGVLYHDDLKVVQH